MGGWGVVGGGVWGVLRKKKNYKETPLTQNGSNEKRLKIPSVCEHGAAGTHTLLVEMQNGTLKNSSVGSY